MALSSTGPLYKGDWDNDNVMQPETPLREALKAVKTADEKLYYRVLNRYPPRQKILVERFMEGHTVESLVDQFESVTNIADQEKVEIGELTRAKLPIHNDDQKQDPVESYQDLPFYNWGKNVFNSPRYTCIPTTVHGVQDIVIFAKQNGCGVRVSGYRHSWSPIFGRDKSEGKPFILISTLRLERAILGAQANEEALGKWSKKETDPPAKETDLNSIDELPDRPNCLLPTQHLVRVGCSTTNEDLRRWCLNNKRLTLPLNVIMVAITVGGSNAPICHGAGIGTKTLSDLVYSVEYVDVNGKHQTIKREKEDYISVASGCFGLLGVVTHLTLIFDKMSYAEMKPVKKPVLEAIPPPKDLIELLPQELKVLYNKYTSKQIEEFQKDFENRALNEYYAEWFWFPLHDQVWINTWSTKEKEISVQDYPSEQEIIKQVTLTFLFETTQESYRKDRAISPEKSTRGISTLAMNSLPANKTISTWLINALHFRRGIQNFRVRDLEVEIPLPPSKTTPTRPDFGIAQKAWWQAIILTYNNIKTCPMRMPLEMRITGDSNVLMAPQRKNTLGTCAIEILTPHFMEAEWPDFAQSMLDKWMTLRNWNDENLNIRPHFAKEWEAFHVDNKPWLQYFKTKSRDEIAHFNKILDDIGKDQGWTRNDLQKMFSNKTLDALFFE